MPRLGVKSDACHKHVVILHRLSDPIDLRETLTFLAAGILAVLALALAVPPFIDWTAYGTVLGTRVGQALRADVRLGGPLSVRLLPSPHFQTGALHVSRPGLDIQADSASLELSLAPLLRGVLSVASAQLDRPQLSIDTRVAEQASALGDLGIDRLALRDASFVVQTATTTRRLDHVDVIASAESTSGPFKAQGFIRAGNRLLPFRIATGAIASRQIAMKLDIDPLAGLPKGEASGMLKLEAQPRFEGAITLSGEVEGAAHDGSAMPWGLKLDAIASADGVRADKVDLHAGAETTQVRAAGRGQVDESGLSLSLSSERPDFDRMRAAFDPARVAAALTSGLSGRAFAIDWRADASVLGGEVVNDAHVALSRRPDDPAERTRTSLSFAVTRGGAISFEGTLQDPAQAQGQLAIRTDDAPAFTRWLAVLQPGLSLPDASVRRADIAARIDLDRERIAAHDLRAVLDRSVLTGRVDYGQAHGRGAPKLTADLKADALNLDALPDLATLGRQSGGVDLSLALDARAIRIARIGRTAVDAGHIALQATRSGDTLSLDRLSLDNLGGATLRASGKVTDHGAHLDATLDAKQLADLAALVRRVAPGPVSDALAGRASLLAPATLDVAFDATSAKNGPLVPAQLTATGKLADTQVRAKLAPRGGDANALDGTLVLEAPDAAPLLRQFGVPVIPIRGQGGAKIEATVSGRSDAPLALTASATIAGATARFDGTTRFDADAREAAGTLKVTAGDLGPLLRIVAAPVDSFAGWPVDASAQVEARNGNVIARAISGRVGGANVSGSLMRDGDAPLAGTLHLDRLDVGSLAAVLLGPPQPEKSDRPWSALTFAPQPNDPPATNVDLSVDRLSFGGTFEAANARAKLAVRAGAIEATDARVDVGGGTVRGGVALFRQEKTASFRTSLQADEVALKLPWFSGRLSGQMDLAGAGSSAATLIGSLGGKGVLRLADGEVARADVGAPLRVAKAVDDEEIALDPKLIAAALARAFDAGPQRLPPLERPVTFAGGQGAVAPFEVAVGSTRLRLGLRCDLSTDRIEWREDIRPTPPDDWAGPPPAVALTLRGPSTAPARTIEAADLVATLASHGITREQARIVAIEADQRERTFFNRRLKFDRALEAQRKAEEARAEAARQEALRQEAARQEALRREAARQEALRQEALRQERERREQRARDVETPAGTAPLDVRPPPATARPGNVPSLIAPDPGMAGRY